MPTTLGPAFPPDYKGLPTHISTEDYSLWLRYRERLQRDARRLYFDVKLGGDEALTAGESVGLGNFWYSVNAKRADVVAEYDDRVRIIELRNNAQANAVGRLLTYKLLWERDPKLSGALELELVSNTTDPDVADACRAYGILYTTI
jgi:hypothetical protein